MLKECSNRVVVFMDILGFKNIINQFDNQEMNKLVYNIMNYFKWIKESNYKGFLAEHDIGKEVTVFSDSIVVSYDASLPGQVFFILLDIIHIQLDLAAKGIFLRGGVSIGNLTHENDIVFGPAMLDAYNLESKIAKYPRIIIDEKVFQFAYNNPGYNNTNEQELEYIEGLVRRDNDGWYYTDYLTQCCELDKQTDIYVVLDSIKNKIQQYINDDNKDIREKYEWLNEYYEWALNQLQGHN